MSNLFLNGGSKKCTSMSKKRIRRNIWKKKGYLVAVKAFCLAKSISMGHSKSFLCNKQTSNKALG